MFRLYLSQLQSATGRWSVTICSVVCVCLFVDAVGGDWLLAFHNPLLSANAERQFKVIAAAK